MFNSYGKEIASCTLNKFYFTLFLLYRGLRLRVLGLFSVDEAGVPFTGDLLVFSLDFVFELSDFVLH